MKSYAHFRRTVLWAATPALLAGGLLCLGGAARAGTPATNDAYNAASDERLAALAVKEGDSASAYYYAVSSVNDAYRCYSDYGSDYGANPSSVADYAAVFSAFAASSGAIAIVAGAGHDYGTSQAEANAAAYYAQAGETVSDYARAVYNDNPTQENALAFLSVASSAGSASDSANAARVGVYGPVFGADFYATQAEDDAEFAVADAGQ